jgi:hypothetical protein
LREGVLCELGVLLKEDKVTLMHRPGGLRQREFVLDRFTVLKIKILLIYCFTGKKNFPAF